jgi:IclR helix-turn-helix domain
MNSEEPISITITLSPAQVEEVVRAASQGRAPSVSTLIANSLSAPLQPPEASSSNADAPREEEASKDAEGDRHGGGYMPADYVDPRLSRSLMRGLSILTCFGPDGGARGIVELAGDLGMSPSTAHRYAFTLVELGLLERCPKTRKYRLPRV